MKYIKTYEQVTEYHVGDYIKLYDAKSITNTLNCLRIYNVEKISVSLMHSDVIQQHRYNVEFVDEFIINPTMRTSWIFDGEIERKSTPEEIEEFKIKENALKYNL